MIHKNVLSTIGNTPVVLLERLAKKHKLKGRIYAKLEFLLPTLSKKDRPAKFMIEEMERTGQLKPGQTVIEATSGNMGISLAMVCAIKGYPFVAVMSEGNSPERALRMKWMGATVELVPQSPSGQKGKVSGEDYLLVEKRFNQLAKQLNAVKVGQFYNELNPEAHYRYTGEEIVRDVPDLDAFCDFMGTFGTLAGITKRLKQHNPKIHCIAIEPSSPQHIIQGGGYKKGSYAFIKKGQVDERAEVTDEEAIYWMKELSMVEGIAGGISSGANLATCVKYLKKNPTKSILFLVNDNFVNYMS